MATQPKTSPTLKPREVWLLYRFEGCTIGVPGEATEMQQELSHQGFRLVGTRAMRKEARIDYPYPN